MRLLILGFVTVTTSFAAPWVARAEGCEGLKGYARDKCIWMQEKGFFLDLGPTLGMASGKDGNVKVGSPEYGMTISAHTESGSGVDVRGKGWSFGKKHANYGNLSADVNPLAIYRFLSLPGASEEYLAQVTPLVHLGGGMNGAEDKDGSRYSKSGTAAVGAGITNFNGLTMSTLVGVKKTAAESEGSNSAGLAKTKETALYLQQNLYTIYGTLRAACEISGSSQLKASHTIKAIQDPNNSTSYDAEGKGPGSQVCTVAASIPPRKLGKLKAGFYVEGDMGKRAVATGRMSGGLGGPSVPSYGVTGESKPVRVYRAGVNVSLGN
jgi:hypothetical protein